MGWLKGWLFLPSVSHGVVRRQCGPDGLWERDDSGQVWRDMAQCEEEKEVISQEVERLNVSTTGESFSVCLFFNCFLRCCHWYIARVNCKAVNVESNITLNKYEKKNPQCNKTMIKKNIYIYTEFHHCATSWMILWTYRRCFEAV